MSMILPLRVSEFHEMLQTKLEARNLKIHTVNNVLLMKKSPFSTSSIMILEVKKDMGMLFPTIKT